MVSIRRLSTHSSSELYACQLEAHSIYHLEFKWSYSHLLGSIGHGLGWNSRNSTVVIHVHNCVINEDFDIRTIICSFTLVHIEVERVQPLFRGNFRHSTGLVVLGSASNELGTADDRYGLLFHRMLT